MPFARWLAAVLAALQGAYMAFDGVHAFVYGEYLVPGGGAHAGTLGPWAQLLNAAHIDPHSTAIETAFVVFGLCWIAAAAGALRGKNRMFRVILAVATLWYVPAGTLNGIIQLALLKAGRA